MQAPYPSHKNKWQKEVEEKRGTQRLKHGDAAKMFNLDKIKVNIITGQRSYTSILLDLSAGGMSALVKTSLPLDLPVEVELFFGDSELTAGGVVKNRNKVGGQFRIGVQFTQLDPEAEGILLLLYVAVVVLVKQVGVDI